MRNKHYKFKGFRLSEEIIKELEKLKVESNLTYNQLFNKLIKEYKK